MKERTFMMIKPDGVVKGLVDEIVSRITATGLHVVASKRMRLDRKLAMKLYTVHRKKEFFKPLIAFTCSGDVVAMCVEGESAITKVRELMGPTNSAQAPAGTIRGDYGSRTVMMENVVHASDSSVSAERELKLFFMEEELETRNIMDIWDEMKHLEASEIIDCIASVSRTSRKKIVKKVAKKQKELVIITDKFVAFLVASDMGVIDKIREMAKK